MDTPKQLLESIYDKGEAYGKTSLELAKLKSIESTTRIATALISRAAVILMLGLFALVLNIGIALWLGELLGHSYYGFFIVAGFYLVAALVFHTALYGWIKKPLSELIITQVLQ